MGIENDQLVFDYLSRVGDLAQGRGLTARDRMQLVARLRSEIDAKRAGGGDVKRILARLGTPEAVVAAEVSGQPVQLPEAPQRSRVSLTSLTKKVPAPRPEPVKGAPPPHLASLDELGSGEEEEPDWWRVDPEPYGPGETVPGFVGGIEIAEIRKPPPVDEEEEASAPPVEQAEEPEGWRRYAQVLKKAPWRRGGAAAPAVADEGPVAAPPPPRPKPSPVLVLSVLLLVAGAVIGSWLALAAGWIVAYSSRKLARAEAKFAVLGVPGLVCGVVLLWMWGRFDGKWGEALDSGRLGSEMVAALPVVVRVAAVASALFLVWRMRRRPR